LEQLDAGRRGSGAGHGGSIYRLSLDAMEIVYVSADVKTGSGKESVPAP
jgi:hypothetical protein